MNIIELPFVKKVGIRKNDDDISELPFEPSILNHIDTIHAGAQYTLAETVSGELLQAEFPELVGKVFPVLRGSDVKYKNAAISTITALATISAEVKQKFSEQFSKKGRALISVDVKVTDINKKLTCIGIFSWFVQKIA